MWWGRRDLNSHGFPHMHLKHARIPIPPRPQTLNFQINDYLFAGASCGGFVSSVLLFALVVSVFTAALVFVAAFAFVSTFAFVLALASTLALVLASGAGVASAEESLVVCKTETLPVKAGIAKSKAETIKRVAAIIVSFDKIVVAPRG